MFPSVSLETTGLLASFATSLDQSDMSRDLEKAKKMYLETLVTSNVTVILYNTNP